MEIACSFVFVYGGVFEMFMEGREGGREAFSLVFILFRNIFCDFWGR